jgi:PAT family beta-lactamase induction signal transducer AmpG
MSATLKQQFAALKNPKMLVVFLMGIASGLVPTLIGGTLLQAWASDSGVDIKTIGLLTMVALPYTLKFLWSPILDRFSLPLGRRKGWILLSLKLLIFAIIGMSFLSPATNIQAIAVASLIIAFLGATLDIALDAWRREYLPDNEISLGLALNTTSYLIAMRLIGGALALSLAQFQPWDQVYRLMALCLVPCIIAIFFSDEPKVNAPAPKNFHESVVLPFQDFFMRKGAWMIIAFILLYKLGDNMGSAISTKYYLDMQYTKIEIGAATKLVGWIAIVAGSLIGGFFMVSMKIRNALFIFGVFQALSTGAFAVLALTSHNTVLLAIIIAFENFTAGLGTAAFSTLIARLTNKRFTATQYALLTSAMGVPRYLSGAPTGYIVDAFGWVPFYIFCALIAIPGIFLSLRVKEDKAGVISI